MKRTRRRTRGRSFWPLVGFALIALGFCLAVYPVDIMAGTICMIAGLCAF